MGSFNKAILIGRIGSINLRTATDSSTRSLTISIVTNRSTKDKETGAYVEKPTWHSVVIYSGPNIDYALSRYEKGDTVLVEGYINNSEYTTSTGEKRIKSTIVVDSSGHTRIYQKGKNKSSPASEDDSENNEKKNNTDDAFYQSLGF